MARRNFTVQLEGDPPGRARIAAARRGTSVSGLVAALFRELADRDARYEAAMSYALDAMQTVQPAGARTWMREDLYDRWERRERDERTFVDTNVLAYANNPAERVKWIAARRALDRLWRMKSGVISSQGAG